jgi:hypothetical protein
MVDNFECMICDYKGKVKQKGDHLGVCKECVRRIKTSWPDAKDVVVVSD